jgi:hypothetical protein
MKAHHWSGLALGVAMICVAPFVAATEGGRVDEPWPSLLASETASVDVGVAMLQLRASLALDRLVQSGRTEAEKL